MKIHAIFSAYTGILFGNFSDFHEYVEEIMERPVFTHELANKELVEEIKEKSKPDFMMALEQIKDLDFEPEY